MTGLLLIDGHSLAYRAFYALPEEMRTASGQVTNAVYGFTSMLINLLRDHRPERVAVAFDLPGGTFRHERLDSYKANRSAPPEIFRQQLGLLRQVLDTLGVRSVDAPGFEADDVLATLATHAETQGLEAAIVTGDRDAFQLVAMRGVTVLYPRRGISDHDVYDAAAVKERTGVEPADYVAYAALRGDTSDNLPGVPGVGRRRRRGSSTATAASTGSTRISMSRPPSCGRRCRRPRRLFASTANSWNCGAIWTFPSRSTTSP